jgi:hypothetical protein
MEFDVGFSNSRPDPDKFVSSLKDEAEVDKETIKHCFTPSVGSVVAISAPQCLLSMSLLNLLLGIGVYLGFTWTSKLDTDAGPHDSRNIMVVYLVSMIFCSLVYSISRFISSAEERREHHILEAYYMAWKKSESAKFRQIWQHSEDGLAESRDINVTSIEA